MSLVLETVPPSRTGLTVSPPISPYSIPYKQFSSTHRSPSNGYSHSFDSLSPKFNGLSSSKSMPYLNRHRSPDGNVTIHGKDTKVRRSHHVQPMTDEDREAMDRLVQKRMARVRRQKVEKMREQQEKQESEKRARERKPPKESLTKDQKAALREVTYGTQEEKARQRKLDNLVAQHNLRLRDLPVEKIWDPTSLRQRRAAELFEREGEEFVETLPQPATNTKLDEAALQKAGFGKHGALEGEVELFVRCKSLVCNGLKTPTLLKVIGHEYVDNAWSSFGQSCWTDDDVNPCFSQRFQFVFNFQTNVFLKLDIVLEGSQEPVGFVNTNLNDIVKAAIEAKEATSDDIKPLNAEYNKEEDCAIVSFPVTSDDSDQATALSNAGALMQCIVFVTPTKMRPPPQGRQAKLAAA